MPARHRLAWLLLVASVGGCTAEDPPRLETSTPPTIQGSITLEIGVLDGPSELIFGAIGGIASDDAGHVFVADLQADEVRAFSRDGAYLYQVAGRGEGPGEVSGPCCLALAPDGLLWVREGGNARYSAFRLDAERAQIEKAVPMEHAAAGLHAKTTVFGDTLVDIGDVPGVPNQKQRLFVVPGEGVVGSELVVEPTIEEMGGAVVDTEINGIQVRFFFHPPFPALPLSAPGPDGVWVEGRTDSYDLVIHRRDGADVAVSGTVFEGPRLSDRERETAAGRIDNDRRRAGNASNRVSWDVPERKQPISDAYFGSDGRLWVEIAVPDGEHHVADIYSSDGVLLERRAWPAGVRFGLYGWVGIDTALGRMTDSLGVQRIARVEWGN